MNETKKQPDGSVIKSSTLLCCCDECLNANIDETKFIGTVLGCFKNHNQTYDKKKMYTFAEGGECKDYA